MDYKIILGASAVIIGLFAYVPYFRDILRGKTKPHIFSWLTWAILETAAFFIVLSEGGGPGAWILGTTGFLCWAVFFLAIRYGEKNITLSDKVSFVGALLGISMWLIVKNPFAAVIIISIADFFGFVPTFRKSYYKPYEETLVQYAVSSFRQVLGVLALRSFTFLTAFYGLSLFVTNTAFVIMVIIRRRSIMKT